MARRRLVTFYVTLFLMLFSAAARAGARTDFAQSVASPGSAPVGFTLKTQGQQTAEAYSQPYTFISASLEYNFYKTYSLILDNSFYRVFDQTNDAHAANGINDLALSLTDKELWVNRYYGLTLKATLSVIAPHASKLAGMLIGGGGSLSLKKVFTDRLSLTYTLGGTEYYYDYDTAYESAKTTIYNTHIMIANRANLLYDVTKALHLQLGATNLTYNNLDGVTYNAYIVSTGMSYDVQKTTSVDFGVRSGYKAPDAPVTWNGPTVSDRMFNSEGITFYLGMTFKI